VNIFGSLIFAGMSGSALADIGGLGRIEIDAMRQKGFTAPFAAAVTSSSAIVGPIFPPSIPLIIYGTVTGVSVIQLQIGRASCRESVCLVVEVWGVGGSTKKKK